MNIPLFLKTFWEWLVIVAFILIIIIRTKARGFFWKAKDGSKLTLRQFFKRWGKGIEGITPLQQVKSQLFGTWIVVTGVISGIVINALVRIENQWWWIEIILVGSIVITAVNMVGLYQRYKILKKVEDTVKQIENQSHNEIQEQPIPEAQIQPEETKSQVSQMLFR